MEFKLTLPGGGVLEYKKEPMDKERFDTVCILIGIFIVDSGFLKFFTLVIGA